MLDISFLLNDPEFTTQFQVIQPLGAWQDGEYILSDPAPRIVQGVVRATGKKDLEMLPEADRVSGAVTFWTQEDIRMDLSRQPVPKLIYAGNTYKALHVENWQDSGYTKIIGTLMGRCGEIDA